MSPSRLHCAAADVAGAGACPGLLAGGVAGRGRAAEPRGRRRRRLRRCGTPASAAAPEQAASWRRRPGAVLAAPRRAAPPSAGAAPRRSSARRVGAGGRGRLASTGAVGPGSRSRMSRRPRLILREEGQAERGHEERDARIAGRAGQHVAGAAPGHERALPAADAERAALGALQQHQADHGQDHHQVDHDDDSCHRISFLGRAPSTRGAPLALKPHARLGRGARQWRGNPPLSGWRRRPARH